MDLHHSLNLLFGNEEKVELRRQIIPLKEKLMMGTLKATHIPQEILLCGSTVEGIAYPRSDLDFMMTIPSYRAVKSLEAVTEDGDLLMVPSDTSAGYCMLLEITEKFDDFVESVDEYRFISSELVKNEMNLLDFDIHGPCLNLHESNVELELTASVFVSFWPDVANDWMYKIRSYGWPTYQMIQNIVQMGCYVVPVGHPDSLYWDKEWRLSFSQAERTLVHSFNHAQFLTYNLLRYMLKEKIEKEFPDTLCSYFIKTAVFYTIEKTPGKLWNLNKLETCYKSCLSVLYEFIDNNNCPNYFIPEYNMFKLKGRLDRADRQRLLDVIRISITIGVADFAGNFPKAMTESCIESKLDHDFLFSHHLQSVLHHIKSLGGLAKAESCKSIACKIMHPILEYGREKQNQIFNITVQMGFLNCCEILMGILSEDKKPNKQTYQVHKMITSLLRFGYTGDVTTGKIIKATYMYLMGKTECALSVIQQLLSNYPTYALDPMHPPSEAYLEVMCGKGYTIDYKAKRACTQWYYIPFSFQNTYPLPLTILKTLSEFLCFHPLTYIYFLECCSHVRLQNKTMSIKSTRSLVKHAKKWNKDSDKFMPTMCVGIVQLAQGNHHSACRWLGSAYIMKNDDDGVVSPRSALIYIACLISKELKLRGLTPAPLRRLSERIPLERNFLASLLTEQEIELD